MYENRDPIMRNPGSLQNSECHSRTFLATLLAGAVHIRRQNLDFRQFRENSPSFRSRVPFTFVVIKCPIPLVAGGRFRAFGGCGVPAAPPPRSEAFVRGSRRAPSPQTISRLADPKNHTSVHRTGPRRGVCARARARARARASSEERLARTFPRIRVVLWARVAARRC